MSWSEIIATATLEKRKTDVDTSSRVVRPILRKAGSISSLYVAKTIVKAKKISVSNLKNKVPHNKRPWRTYHHQAPRIQNGFGRGQRLMEVKIRGLHSCRWGRNRLGVGDVRGTNVNAQTREVPGKSH